MTTIDKKEIEKFEKLAQEWWDPEGKFKPLHKLNPFRIQFIKEKLVSYFALNHKSLVPLKGLKVLDIGSGGGLLSEPITRLGAKVTGVDASKKNINVAKIHSKNMKLNINYKNGTIEKFNFINEFDVILNMEVVEHVANPELFIKKCSESLKENGVMFVSTINRTLKSYVQAIIGAEYILKWLPIGTHDWNKFITPEELIKISNKNKLSQISTFGLKLNIINGKWKVVSDCSVNYISFFKKN